MMVCSFCLTSLISLLSGMHAAEVVITNVLFKFHFFADLNVPNEECDDNDPTIAVVTATAAAILIVIAAVIACFVMVIR